MIPIAESMPKNSHSFCIVEESDCSRSTFIAETIERAVSDDCAVILASESNPDSVAELLDLEGLDSSPYINRGLLTILDRHFVYSMAKARFDANGLSNKWSSLSSKVKKKTGCKGIVAIGPPRVFFETNNLDKLIEYEKSYGRRFEGVPFEAICCYYSNDFSKLSLNDIIQILDYHEYVVYQGGKYLRWHPNNMILAIINSAIDNAFGTGTSSLLLKTLELIYNIDNDKIVGQPEIFEDKLRKVLGITAQAALDRIRIEIINELSYLRNTERGIDQ